MTAIRLTQAQIDGRRRQREERERQEADVEVRRMLFRKPRPGATMIDTDTGTRYVYGANGWEAVEEVKETTARDSR
jgi:hypothetical protein